MNQFVTLERQISVQMVQLLKVDHLHRWSEIFGSERNKTDLSTGLLTKISGIFGIMESTRVLYSYSTLSYSLFLCQIGIGLQSCLHVGRLKDEGR